MVPAPGGCGCHVIYGLDGYKVHSKLCQIMKKKMNVEYYTQIGTGNYNEKTARLYTDLSLMTADPKIGMEAARGVPGTWQWEKPLKIWRMLQLGKMLNYLKKKYQDE